ncbi:MAG: fused MFS/spermidine synthase [Anaerolineae bacterium]|jgi:spermidine synthase
MHATQRRSLRQRLWNPHAVVFVSSFCIMVIELVASRLTAPVLGVSLYTWTSVIGVIMAGIALGNYTGGRLADRWASPWLLGVLFALAALFSLSILLLRDLVRDMVWPQWMPLMGRVLAHISLVFFLPGAVLGCISPVIVRLSMTDVARSGTTVGRIYAWSTVGSIAGTFATGFFLISWFGTKTIIVGAAGVLTLMGLWFVTDAPWRQAILRAAIVILVIGASLLGLRQADLLASECLRETNYFCINVNTDYLDEDRIALLGFDDEEPPVVHTLVLDRLVHSYTLPEHPGALIYGYERSYAQVIEPLAERNPGLRSFFIGGGGYTFPRYMEETYPESEIVVAEIDPGVTEIARVTLGLQGSERIEAYDEDARTLMASLEDGEPYDLIFGDAFNDFSVPYHLTTLEFTQLVDRLLADDGLYVANIVDGGGRGSFMRAFVRTQKAVFEHVAVIPTISSWRSAPRTTWVVVASQEPLELDHITSPGAPLPQDELDEYLAMEPPLILTDDYVPVDNLLAPVFVDSEQG